MRNLSLLFLFAIVFAIVICPIAKATKPTRVHSVAPSVTIEKALLDGGKFLTSLKLEEDYYVATIELIEGSMLPAPTGSIRHWKIAAKTPGAKKESQLILYVDMMGHVSKSVPTPKAANDLRGIKIRMGQLKIMGNNEIKQWPKDDTGLFQGGQKTLKFKVTDKESHQKAINLIPKHCLVNHRATKTIERDGWYYTSFDFINSDRPTFFSLVAIKKGTNKMLFSYTW